VRGGCPLNNLAQEMSPRDEGFRNRLAIVLRERQEGIAAALREKQAHGRGHGDAVPAETAVFLVAMLEGYAALAENAQDSKVLKVGVKNIEEWLRSLRAGPTAQRGTGMKAACNGSNAVLTKFPQQGRPLRQRCRTMVTFVTSDSAQRLLLLRPRVDSIDRLR
jgi:hypothetical protein